MQTIAAVCSSEMPMKTVYAFVIIVLVLCLSSMFTSNDEPRIVFTDMDALPIALDMPIK
jgi:hypothetical protein